MAKLNSMREEEVLRIGEEYRYLREARWGGVRKEGNEGGQVARKRVRISHEKRRMPGSGSSVEEYGWFQSPSDEDLLF